MPSRRLPHLASRLQGFGTTIFAEMTALAQRHDAVNLGQGFPDFPAPQALKEAASDAVARDRNQYAPGIGVPALRVAIAEHQDRFWGLRYDADTEVTVTAGATEAVFATLQALCEVGDEVVTFSPTYDSYSASIAMAGAVERALPLRAPDFAVDGEALRAVVSPKTRAVLVNTPHNPTGRVLTRDELAAIAEVCVDHDLVAITDDVYEHLVYEGEHVPLATLPGMRERTIGISSAGKTFSVTGWKIGWICAPPALTAAVRTAKQFITFTNGTPFQHAIAEALTWPDRFFDDLQQGYRARRDRLVRGLAEAGFTVLPPAGTYFALADIRPLGEDDDVVFCRALPERVGVVAIPCSVFSDVPPADRHLVRFAFCKSDAVLDEGVARLRRLR